jgi:hypothetical protein
LQEQQAAAAGRVGLSIHVSSYYYTRALILYMCPHTIHVSSYCILQEQQAAAAGRVGGVSEGGSDRGRSNRAPKSEARVPHQPASGEDRAERVIRLAVRGRFS